MDSAQIIEAISKAPLVAMILGVCYGLAFLVTAWRGGKASESEKTSLNERLELVEGRLAKAEKKLERVMGQFYTMRAQRDDAQNYARLLEQIYSHQPPKTWPVDPPPEDE